MHKTSKKYPSEFFWLCPSSEISFETTEKALQYAKNRCIQALNNPVPFERGVFIKDNTILKEIDGDENHINILFSTDFTKDTIFIHGHPKEVWWLSWGDILTCLEKKIKTREGIFGAKNCILQPALLMQCMTL